MMKIQIYNNVGSNKEGGARSQPLKIHNINPLRGLAEIYAKMLNIQNAEVVVAAATQEMEMDGEGLNGCNR